MSYARPMRSLPLRVVLAAAIALGATACFSSTEPTDVGARPDAHVIDAPGLDAPLTDDAPSTLADAATSSACTRNSECGLRPASCCGRCGAATETDFIGARVDELAALGAAICEAEGNPGCPECASPDDPFLAAVCRSSACVGVNLHLEPITECATPVDCALAPRECCGCGLYGVSGSVAFNPARGRLSDYLCDDDSPCPPCVPSFESGVSPSCVDGRCVVFGPD